MQLLTEHMFFEIGVIKNFAIFRGKHLCAVSCRPVTFL